MSRKPSNYIQVLEKLKDLNKKHPSYGIGRHISMALMDYGDYWGITDKEFLHALEKYEAELEMDIVPDKDLDQIIKDGENLDTLFINDEEEEEDY